MTNIPVLSVLDILWTAVKYIVIGYLLIRLFKCLHILVRSIHAHFIARPLKLDEYKNSWTVVTGCTDGIGRAYVEELAQTRGLRRFVLIGRNPNKLAEVASDLERRFDGCQLRKVVFDFDTSDYRTLEEQLTGMDVGILVNCAGMATDRIGTLVELPADLPSRILRVNLMSTVKMTEIILPRMVKQDRGIVVNISSILGWRPFPYMSTYPASKAGISFFTDALVDEFKSTKLKIQCLLPMLVATKMASYESTEANNLFVLDTREFARQAVRTIGLAPLGTGAFQHDLQIAFGSLLGMPLFKLFFVPFGLLRVHRRRLERYRQRYGSHGNKDSVRNMSRDFLLNEKNDNKLNVIAAEKMAQKMSKPD